MDGARTFGPPSVAGQFGDAELWEQAGWSIKIFDLSKDQDIADYEELLTLSSKEDPEVVIVDQDKQFCKTVENWKIFVTSVNIKYRNLTKNEKKE